MATRRSWKLKRPRKHTHRPLSAWQKSEAFKEVARAALRAINSGRKHAARCTAKSKTTGDQCRQLALGNGKCHWHGGATPKGSEWGKRQWRAKPPGQHAAGDWRWAEAKLKKRAEQDQDRVRRLKAMTDEQFWSYLRKMGRRLDDIHAPVFRKAVRDEKARRGPDPLKAPLWGAVRASSKSSSDVAAIEREIASLRELQASQDNTIPTKVDEAEHYGGVFE